MRKIYVDLKVRIIVEAEDNLCIGEVVQELDYNIHSRTLGAVILDTQIADKWDTGYSAMRVLTACPSHIVATSPKILGGGACRGDAASC